MLVLTRRVGEEIVIGADIRVTVTAVIGNKVRIGITAPPVVRVDRREIHERRSGPARNVCPPAICRRAGHDLLHSSLLR